MIPIRDSAQTRRFPIVNLSLILICVVVFLHELTLGSSLDAFVLHWGAIPSSILRVLGGDRRVPYAVLLTLITAQFIHAGWSHLLGNMLFLWVFGRAVEDRLGHFLYLIFYLLWGVGAVLVQIIQSGPVREPLIGASGAISGVLGAYFLLFPGAWVSLLVPIFFFFWVFDIPALLVLAYWFLVQFLSGTAAITHASADTVAFWAHIGGFLFGAASAVLFPKPHSPPTLAGRRSSGRTATGGALSTMGRLISLATDIVVFLVAMRVLLLFFGFEGHGVLSPLVKLLQMLTAPLVDPFAGVLPTVLVQGRVLDLSSVAAALAYWAVGALLAWVIVSLAKR